MYFIHIFLNKNLHVSKKSCTFAVKLKTRGKTKTNNIMKSLKGTYKFGRHYNGWSIWQITDDEGMCASHVYGEEFATAKSAHAYI